MSYQQVLRDIEAGHFAEAIAHLEPLLQESPDDPKLWYAKSLALLSSERPEAAAVAAEEAIRLQPGMAVSHHLLGKARSQLRDIEGSISSYKQAARCYIEQKDRANAQTCLTQIEQLQSLIVRPQPSVGGFLEEVTAKIQKGRWREALQELNWLLQLEPNNGRALAQRGLVRARTLDYQGAVRDLARAMELSPQDPDLRWQRGQMRLLIGDAAGAISDFTGLLQVPGVDLVEVYTRRGEAYRQLKDLERAGQDFSQALSLDPNNPDCYKARASIYEDMGNLEEALANYHRAASLSLDRGNWSLHRELQHHIKTLQPQIQSQKEEVKRIIRVPIKYLSGGGRGTPVVEVLFNGCCPFDMILDTGAETTCINQQMASLLNVVPTGTGRFELADGSIVEEPVGFVKSVAIGQAKVDNLRVAIAPKISEGLLGQNYLWRFDVRILRTEVELYWR